MFRRLDLVNSANLWDCLCGKPIRITDGEGEVPLMDALGKRIIRLREQRKALTKAVTSLTDTGIEMWMIVEILEEDARAGAPSSTTRKLAKVHRKRIERFAEACEKLSRRYAHAFIAEI